MSGGGGSHVFNESLEDSEYEEDEVMTVKNVDENEIEDEVDPILKFSQRLMEDP